MSLYDETKTNPPKLVIKENAKEVIFNLVSCMCDNKSFIRLKKDSEEEFRLSHYSIGTALAFTNLQTECDKTSIEWAADEYDWEKAIFLINTGMSKVYNVRSR